MAGFGKKLNENENRYINKWLLELTCFTAYQEFMCSGTVDDLTGRNFVQGVLYRVEGRLTNADSVRDVRLIRLLCLLADGNDPDVHYEDEGQTDNTSERTILENALHEYSAITSREMNSEFSFHEKVFDFENDIRQQAVYASCRCGKFDEAQEVYNRVWNPIEHDSEQNMEICKNLKGLIKNKRKAGGILEENSYQSFMEKAKFALTEIVQQCKDPFIVSAAKRVGGKVKPLDSPFQKRKKLKSDTTSSPKKSPRTSQSNETATENNSVGLDEKSIERLHEELDLNADDRILQGLASNFHIPHDQKHMQLNDVKKKTLLQKLKRVRKGKKEYEAELFNRIVNPTEQKTRREDVESIKVGSKSNKDTALPRTSANTKSGDDNESPSDGASGSPGKVDHFTKDTSIRTHKLRKNLNRPDRHRMPDLESSDSEHGNVSDLDMTPFPRLNETVIDTFRKRSVKKKRRPLRVMWTDSEEKLFFQGVMELGQGNWSSIKTWGNFNSRTGVHLKDKWRTICNRTHRLKELRNWYRTSGGFSTPERQAFNVDSD